VLDNYSPHLSTNVDTRVGEWAEVNNVELAGGTSPTWAPGTSRYTKLTSSPPAPAQALR